MLSIFFRRNVTITSLTLSRVSCLQLIQAVLSSYLKKPIFTDLSEHTLECEPTENHAEKYLQERYHYTGKQYTTRNHVQKVQDYSSLDYCDQRTSTAVERQNIVNLKFYKLCDVAHKVAEVIIDKRQKEQENDPIPIKERKVKDFLDTLLAARDDDGLGLSSFEIRNVVDTFLFEGHDTTASSMTWALYSLAQHGEYQERVYKEVIGILDSIAHLEW